MAATISLQVKNNTGIRRMTKKKIKPKTLLTTPYNGIWPSLSEQEEIVMRTTLNSIIPSLNMGKIKKVSIEPSKHCNDIKLKNQMKKDLRKKYWTEGFGNRSHLVFGISQVIRGLEKDNLIAVLVSKDVTPITLIDPILQLCSQRNIKAVSIKGLCNTLKNCLHFNSCSAFGFKKSVEALDASHAVNKLYIDVTSKMPLLKEDSNLNRYDNPVHVAHEPPVVEKVCPPKDKDYNYLYIRKDQIETLQSKSELFLPLDLQSTSTTTSLLLNPIAPNSKKRYREMKFKKIESKKNRIF